MIERIVGLDLSLNSAGLAKIRADGSGLWESMAITVGACPKEPMWDRYDLVAKAVMQEVGVHDVVFIEDYAFGRRDTLTLLAELGGIVRYMLWKKTGHWPFSIPISSLKKFATGSGSAKKEDIKLALYKKHRLEFKTNDEADALVLAQVGALMLGFGCPVPDRPGGKWYGYELDVVQTLRKKRLKPRNAELQTLANDLVKMGNKHPEGKGRRA